MRNNSVNKKNGFTLMEAMIVTGILGIITLSVITVLITWQRSWDISEAQMAAQFEARRMMRRMAEDLVQGSPDNTNVTANDKIIFYLPNSYAGGNITWGDKMQYSLAGVDGRQLLRTNLNSGEVEIIGSYVNSLNFTLIDDKAEIELNVSKTFKGNTFPMNLTSQVHLRNRKE